MSASCELNINFVGSEEEFNAFIEKLKEIEGPKTNPYIKRPHYPFYVKEHEVYADNGRCRNIWGDDYLEPTPDMYLALAKVAPDAAFEVTSQRVYEVGGGGCETYLTVDFKNRELTFRLQPRVDTYSLVGLGSWNNSQESVTVAIVGRMKFHETHEELKDYLEMYDVKFAESITKGIDYVICNYPNSAKKSIARANELNVPVISEAKAIRMFGDTYDFDDGDAIIQDMTYEEFASLYQLDDDVTPEAFEKAKKNEESFVLYSEDRVSLEGPWLEKVYILNKNNEFEMRKGD